MQAIDDRISIAVIGLHYDLGDLLDSSLFWVRRYDELPTAIPELRNVPPAVIVLKQSELSSLEGIERQTTPIVGEGRTIVLSPRGPVFVPGLYVVDAGIRAETLGSIVHRIGSRHM